MVLAAVVQLCSTACPVRNLSLAQSVIARAAAAGAKLVWLPEASDFIAPAADVPSLSEPLVSSYFLQGIQEAAERARVFVGVGVHETPRPGSDDAADGRCYNTNVLVSPCGEVTGMYRKIHLFDVDLSSSGGTSILESRTTIPGNDLGGPHPTRAGMVGMLTCYDLRFPEVSLMLRKRGADIITYPSAFTMRTGAAHWEVLLRARAIETQCYILAPAQVGYHSPTRQSYGHACIVDPWGTVIAQCGERVPPTTGGTDDDATFAIADIDLAWLQQIRAEMPLWEQRREDVYNST